MNSKLFYAGVIYIVALYIMLVCGDIYSSAKEMKNLVTIQKSVAERLKTYLYVEMDKISRVRSYVNQLKEQHNEVIADTQKYVGNPMNRFLFTKRLTSDLEFIKTLVDLKPVYDLDTRTAFKLDSSVTYPRQEDLTAVASSVARLQETYLLDVQHLAAGKLKEYRSPPMSITDCYELGRVLYEDHNYDAAKFWLLQAHRMADPAIRKRNPMLVAKIVEALCYAYISLYDKKNIKKWVKKLKDLKPGSEFTSEVRAFLKKKRELENGIENKKKRNEAETNNLYEYVKKYGRLCRGEMKLLPEIQSRLKCRYLMNNPYLKLAPLKMEQLYINPDVYLFYDVMSDTEIEKIKYSGYPKLARALVRKNLTGEISKGRISFYSWLSSASEPIIDKVYSRIEDMTGLSTTSAEELQLALYPPGGYYNSHFDTYENENELGNGNRIATVMFYLSDVKEGGATVFIHLGLAVFPIKGAALFWHNTHSSGKTHGNTLHSACPVLLGYKWAANVWLHAYRQEFLRPCEIGGDKVDETLIPPVWTLADSNSLNEGENVKST